MTHSVSSHWVLPGRQTPWDTSAACFPEPGFAVAVSPSGERVAQMHEEATRSIRDRPQDRPPGWTPEWRDAVASGLSTLLAGKQLPGAWVPALGIPRFVHGQSQGICDLFGASVDRQSDGNYFVRPVAGDKAAIDRIRPRPLRESMYWGAVEWIRYARAATRGRFPFRNPVMCGPFDLANYLLGTTRLMEWVYTEPATVHGLLEKTSAVIIDMMRALRDAAGGTLHALHFSSMANLFDLCSECRSLVSAEMFEEYDAPYLRRIGEAVGPYAIHSCGSWERTVPLSVQDPNLKGMNGQVRENDLPELCRLSGGRVVLSIGPSTHLPERFTWPDRTRFLEYVLQASSPRQPIEIRILESEMELYTKLYGRTRGGRERAANPAAQTTTASRCSTTEMSV